VRKIRNARWGIHNARERLRGFARTRVSKLVMVSGKGGGEKEGKTGSDWRGDKYWGMIKKNVKTHKGGGETTYTRGRSDRANEDPWGMVGS